MAKVIERNVPIAEENVTLSGQPATNMFEDWSEEMTDKAENPYDENKVRTGSSFSLGKTFVLPKKMSDGLISLRKQINMSPFKPSEKFPAYT